MNFLFGKTAGMAKEELEANKKAKTNDNESFKTDDAKLKLKIAQIEAKKEIEIERIKKGLPTEQDAMISILQQQNNNLVTERDELLNALNEMRAQIQPIKRYELNVSTLSIPLTEEQKTQYKLGFLDLVEFPDKTETWKNTKRTKQLEWFKENCKNIFYIDSAQFKTHFYCFPKIIKPLQKNGYKNVFEFTRKWCLLMEELYCVSTDVRLTANMKDTKKKEKIQVFNQLNVDLIPDEEDDEEDDPNNTLPQIYQSIINRICNKYQQNT